MLALAPAAPSAPQWVVESKWRVPLDLLLIVALAFTIVPDALNFSDLDSFAQFQSTDYGFVARVQWFPLFAIGLAIILMRLKLAWALFKEVNPFLVAIMLWIIASTLWSYEPEISFRRGFKIVGMMWVAYAFFLVSWEPMGVLRALRTGCYWLCAASVIFVLVKPEYGIHQGVVEPGLKGAWRGVTNHKNGLGILTAVSVCLWVHAWASRDLPLRKCLLPLAATFICLIGSRSTTALLASIATGGAVIYFLRAPPRLRSPMFLIAGFALVMALLSLLFIFTGIPTPLEALGALAGGFGKDATLTGRDAIWGAVITEIGKHPWIGCGFNGYWVIGQPWGPSGDVLRSIGFAPLQAHNGYLDILNELGIIGFVLLIGMLVWQFRQIAQVNRFDRSTAAFGFAYLVYDLILNITESNFLRPTFLPCLVEFIVIVACARSMLQHKFRQQYALAEAPSLPPPTSLAKST